ncbi:MAG: hypothetical protein AAGI03_03155 [Pseudomonadota bacterium]
MGAAFGETSHVALPEVVEHRAGGGSKAPRGLQGLEMGREGALEIRAPDGLAIADAAARLAEVVGVLGTGARG